MIIDDRIPCLKDGNDQPIPMFAKCENKNLFWAPLIEKAYAKLHQRYLALGGGSTVEALHDLTGQMVETCFFDAGDQMTIKGPVKGGLLFTALKTLWQDKCLLGARFDMEMFPVMKDSTKQKLYAEAEGMGIHARYMYSVLDTREVMTDVGNGKFEKQLLVRLKDPWGNSNEWKGACSDFDKAFWTDDVKARFTK